VLCAALASAAAGVPASAVSVLYQVDVIAFGVYQYNLLVDNTGGGEDLSGLNVLRGSSVFGLDGSSTIAAPADWGWFEPLPPLIDDLNWFSLDALADVPVNGSLGGFSFISDVHPSELTGDDFAVEGIGADCHCQIDLGNATPVPEPGTALLLGSALAGLAARRRARREP
jgi:hypothetical protein